MPLPLFMARETEAQRGLSSASHGLRWGLSPCGHLSSVHPCPAVSPSMPHPTPPAPSPLPRWVGPEDPVPRKGSDKRLPRRDNPLLKHACCSNYKGDQIGFKLELIGCPLIHAIYLALTSPSGRVGWKGIESHLLPH